MLIILQAFSKAEFTVFVPIIFPSTAVQTLQEISSSLNDFGLLCMMHYVFVFR